jgi:hypothetical protein
MKRQTTRHGTLKKVGDVESYERRQVRSMGLSMDWTTAIPFCQLDFTAREACIHTLQLKTKPFEQRNIRRFIDPNGRWKPKMFEMGEEEKTPEPR